MIKFLQDMRVVPPWFPVSDPRAGSLALCPFGFLFPGPNICMLM